MHPVRACARSVRLPVVCGISVAAGSYRGCGHTRIRQIFVNAVNIRRNLPPAGVDVDIDMYGVSLRKNLRHRAKNDSRRNHHRKIFLNIIILSEALSTYHIPRYADIASMCFGGHVLFRLSVAACTFIPHLYRSLLRVHAALYKLVCLFEPEALSDIYKAVAVCLLQKALRLANA